MYLDEWGLSRRPFRESTQPEDYFATAGHDEALARLYFLVEDAHPFGVIYGPTGCGKTLLLAVLAEQARRTQRKVVFVDATGLTADELVRRLGDRLQLGLPERLDHVSLWRRVEEALTATQHAGMPVLLIFDQLERAGEGCVPVVERLVHGQSRAHLPGGSTVTVVAAVEMIGQLGRLARLAGLSIGVKPWTSEEVAAFVRQRMEQAGSPNVRFTPQALQQLAIEAEGSPREVNRLASLAVLAAAGEGLDEVTDEIVRDAAAELLPPRWRLAG